MKSVANIKICPCLKVQHETWIGNRKNCEDSRLYRISDRIKNDKNVESFHRAIGTILAVAQFFGILPVYGVRSKSPNGLTFKLLSLRSIYAIVIIIAYFIIFFFTVLYLVFRGKPFASSKKEESTKGLKELSSAVFFYAYGVLGTIFFLRLSPRWISVQRHWRATEQLLNKARMSPLRLRRPFSLLASAFLFIGTLEHVTGFLVIQPDEKLFSKPNQTAEEMFRTLITTSYPSVFSIVNYSHGIGVFLTLANAFGGFVWNFSDLFIMLISIGLVQCYKSLNDKVIKLFTIPGTYIEWHEIREYYAALSMLVKQVDDAIAPITLLSLVNNFYYICLQLFIGLSVINRTWYRCVYFFASFAFVAGRTIAMITLAARINDHSKVILPHLFTFPGSLFNSETQRLQNQLAVDQVCLTGMGYFSITRNFMLTVAGTIVTYEVFLLNSAKH